MRSTFSGPSRPRSTASLARNPEPYPLFAACDVGADLPRVGEVLPLLDVSELYTTKRVVVIGIHGGTIMRTLLGEPTGTSPMFASKYDEGSY